MLRRQAKRRGPNPYSAVRFHDGYVFDPVRFTVLTASQMAPDIAEMVSSALKTVTTGPEAMTLPRNPGWACTEVGINQNGFSGRVYVVSYCGIEVALFFKRQLTEIKPEPGDKTPEGVLQDPKEAWQRLDLLGRSAEKSNFVLTQTQRRLEETIRLLEARVKSMDDLNDALVHEGEEASNRIRNLEIQKATFEKELKKVTHGLRFGGSLPIARAKPLKSLKSKGKRGKHRRMQRSKPKYMRPKRIG